MMEVEKDEAIYNTKGLLVWDKQCISKLNLTIRTSSTCSECGKCAHFKWGWPGPGHLSDALSNGATEVRG